MMIVILILLATVFLAYTNGANDNFKGVATLFGSGTTNYKKAILWATITTFAGSIAAIFISQKLIVSFSGKGLVPDTIVNNPQFLIAVGFGAALTILLATVSGIPVSTTHAITGALIGTGLIAAGTDINLSILGNKFFIPLLLSPFIAMFLTFLIYPCFRFARITLGIERRMCLCIGETNEVVCIKPDGTAVLQSSGVVLTIDQLKNCQQYYRGEILGFNSQNIIDKLHYISSGAVGFARGLNDAPKIVAILLVINAFSLKWGIVMVSVAMAIGGLLSAKRVAMTMSRKITRMNHGQGFSANVVTAFLVIFASQWGVPVSTTHVSCGSLFGIGLVNKKANKSVIRHIILAWVLTLPLAGILSIICFIVINNIR